jgi:hypothetical protein
MSFLGSGLDQENTVLLRHMKHNSWELSPHSELLLFGKQGMNPNVFFRLASFIRQGPNDR